LDRNEIAFFGAIQQPVDNPLARGFRDANQTVLAGADTLDFKLLPLLDAIFSPQFGGEYNLPFRGYSGLHAM
jgi:hypothetical protein